MNLLHYTTYTTYTLVSDAQERRLLRRAADSTPAWTFKSVVRSVASGTKTAWRHFAEFCREVHRALAEARTRNIHISAS